jgi:hypothetical protein
MLTRILVEESTQRLPQSTAFRESGAVTASPDATIELNVQRLDEDASGSLVLQAQATPTASPVPTSGPPRRSGPKARKWVAIIPEIDREHPRTRPSLFRTGAADRASPCSSISASLPEGTAATRF